MTDLPTKYNTLENHKTHIGYYRRDGLEWYGIASYAVEDAGEGIRPRSEECKAYNDEVREYLAQFMTPKHLSFVIFTGDSEYLGDGTAFAALPIKDDGEAEMSDGGIFSRFDWLLEVTDTFNDIPFKCSNEAESMESSSADLETTKRYFESKGFKVVLENWDELYG